MLIPLGNAAGFLRTADDLSDILAVSPELVSFVTIGSYTVHERAGNSGDTYWDDDMARPTSLNSRGMPNGGYECLKDPNFDLPERIRAAGKKSRISIAGFNPSDYRMLASLFCSGKSIDVIELNLGCPNTDYTPTSFKPGEVEEVLKAVYSVTDHVGSTNVHVKLSPYSDPGLLYEIATVINNRPAGSVQAVVTCNTFPHALAFDKSANLQLSTGTGGLGGAAMKHIALGQVYQFRNDLDARIKVIGVGGVSTWHDVRDMKSAGASEVQIGTAFGKYGASVFTEIAAQYALECE